MKYSVVIILYVTPPPPSIAPPPKIVSSMAAIQKPDGAVRLIHDCSRSPGKSVNDYNSADWHQKFAELMMQQTSWDRDATFPKLIWRLDIDSLLFK